MYILKILTFHHILFLIFSDQNTNPSPRTGSQDLLVTHYNCEENEQKTLHKYVINQVSQSETEPQAIETTNVKATLYSKGRATTVTGYKFTATFSEKKVHCSQVSNRNKNRLDHESFYQSLLEKIQLTRDLIDNTMIYQGIRLPCKNDQGYCDPTTRTQATIVRFPEDTSTTFQVAKIHARMIKFH